MRADASRAADGLVDIQRPTLTEIILWPAFFLVLVIYGLGLLRGGYLHYEGQFFLSNYLDGRGSFQKVFSAHSNDWDCNQGRELGFLFSLFDSEAIVVASRLGFPLLYSLSSVVSILAAAVMLWRLIPRIAPRLSIMEAGLIVSLMLVTPSVALSSYYYRPAKALVVVFLVMASWQAFQLTAGDRNRKAPADAALLFITATLMELSDPQGIFFTLVLIVAIAGVAGFRTRSVRLAYVALFSALVAHTIWQFTLGPRLSLIADGFPSTRGYVHVAVKYTFGHLHHYTSALSLWLDDLGYFFGSSGKIGGAVGLILIGAAYWIRPSGAPKGAFVQRQRPFLVLLVISAMLFALYTAMYAKLPSIVWPESRLVYYWIPLMVVIAIVASIALESSFAVSRRLRAPVSLALGLMLCTSIISLPRHEEVVRNGEQREMIAESGRVRDCMRSANTPIAEFRLNGPGAQACSSVRIAAFGSAGPGPAIKSAVPNPLLWCRQPQLAKARRNQPALRSLGP